jgi:hypothetical protein
MTMADFAEIDFCDKAGAGVAWIKEMIVMVKIMILRFICGPMLKVLRLSLPMTNSAKTGLNNLRPALSSAPLPVGRESDARPLVLFPIL